MDLQELLRKVQSMRLTTRLAVEHRLAGEFMSAQRGAGMEFEQVRLYQPGDDVRTIDWNVSARMQETYVKEFRQLRELSLMLLVDLSASGWYGEGRQLKQYIAYELAAVLAFTSMREQHRIGLIGYTLEPEVFIAPAKGKKHMVHLLRNLVNHVPAHKGTALAPALDLLSAVHRSRSLVVVISDFLDTSGYEEKVRRLLQHHELAFIRLYHPQEASLQVPGMVPVADIEQDGYGWAFRSRWRQGGMQPSHHFKDLHHRLQQFCHGLGIRYLALDITQDYSARLESFFATQR
ncbi:MAG: DUF58 domain-containing protein [Bacteroidetes bacterium]|nr:DUF58 domain-containing protein [Bacteroidota bacterium]